MARSRRSSIDDDLAPPDYGAPERSTEAPPIRPKQNKPESAEARGPRGFDVWYTGKLGERWSDLRAASQKEALHFELSTGLLKPYYLDIASVLASLAVEAKPGMRVLDLCAAPGGKSLALAQQLFNLDVAVIGADNRTETESQSSLCLNERSADRRGRLRKVIEEHLPMSVQASIRISGHDANRWGMHEQAVYDRILLDVPCSSERHLIQNPKYLADWSPGRSIRLADQAFAMLLSAAKSLIPGGSMVYSTCALSPLENDEVVDRALERTQKASSRLGLSLEIETVDTQSLIERLHEHGRETTAHRPNELPAHSGNTDKAGKSEAEWIERSRNGYRIWPDRAGGRGPIYFCRIRRTG